MSDNSKKNPRDLFEDFFTSVPSSPKNQFTKKSLPWLGRWWNLKGVAMITVVGLTGWVLSAYIPTTHKEVGVVRLENTFIKNTSDTSQYLATIRHSNGGFETVIIENNVFVNQLNSSTIYGELETLKGQDIRITLYGWRVYNSVSYRGVASFGI